MSGRCHLVRELCFAHHHLQKYRLKDLQIELKQHHSVSSPISTVVFLVWVWDCFPVYPEELCLGDKLHGRIKCLSITQLADIKFNATLSLYMLTAAKKGRQNKLTNNNLGKYWPNPFCCLSQIYHFNSCASGD